ncbi:MAG: hypothetical protein IV085_13785 [Thiobacillus sp.]|nr:hypothetical protein [Thiobacillus sp.]
MGDWSVWLAWLMFIGIFPLGIGMLFRAWKIGVRKDYRYVADWRGRAFQDGARWAVPVLATNTVGGAGLLLVGVLVVLLALPFALWTGATALIIWSYFFALQTMAHRAKAA